MGAPTDLIGKKAKPKSRVTEARRLWKGRRVVQRTSGPNCPGSRRGTTAGFVTGALVGGLLLGVVPDLVLIPVLAVALLISAINLAHHN